MKKCFKCLSVKPLDDFYRHAAMADGRLGKCKSCTKNDSTTRRWNKIDQVREYDRSRPYRTNQETVRAYRQAHPERRAAHVAVGNAVRDGRLTRETCAVCGEKAHAHHDDYSKPLEVRWLCPIHHRLWHDTEAENAPQ